MPIAKLAPLSSLGIRIRFQPSWRNSADQSVGLETNSHLLKDPTEEATECEYGLPQSSTRTFLWKGQTTDDKTTDKRGIP